MKRSLWLLQGMIWAFLALLAGCGGGSGHGLTGYPQGGVPFPPHIEATVMGFAPGNVPTTLVSSPSANAVVIVVVQNNTTQPRSPMPDALVSINGQPLSYDTSQGIFRGEISIALGDTVQLSVQVSGVTHTATNQQIIRYPVITDPYPGAPWYFMDSKVVRWSPGYVISPAVRQKYLIAVTDGLGKTVLPPNKYFGAFNELYYSALDQVINPNSLPIGDNVVFVGLADSISIPSATSDSYFQVGGFHQVSFSVTSTPPVVLSTIDLSPPATMMGLNETKSFMAQGKYSDNSFKDISSQVVWTSSNPAVASINNAGAVTSLTNGVTTIRATLGAISGTATVSVTPPDLGKIATSSVTYQGDASHAGRFTFGQPLVWPRSSTPDWSVNLGTTPSYPLIVGGRVYALTKGLPNGGSGSLVHALDLATGTVVWGPVVIPGVYYDQSAYVYAQGRVVVVNDQGLMRTFDAATGQEGWSIMLPGKNIFLGTTLTSDGSTIYAHDNGDVYAIDASNGNLIWSVYLESGAQFVHPTVSQDGVFMSYSYSCRSYKLAKSTGMTLWVNKRGCNYSTIGFWSPVYANGILYITDAANSGLAEEVSTGLIQQSFGASTSPAISGQMGYFLSSGTLRGIDQVSQNVFWSFAGDGSLAMAPVVIDNAVVVGSTTGTIYALDTVSGRVVWTGQAGASLRAPDPEIGMGVGDGYLVVPTALGGLSAWRLIP
ncbi:PQQ-binding-like beta-propeller repeat protein [Leptothrix ochracea]|uniref:outer membrane protein assembly factor BamB family protein n=1 Tax=Leptothrix ochracea TaxID=735331 RepID=UPI0034E2D573